MTETIFNADYFGYIEYPTRPDISTIYYPNAGYVIKNALHESRATYWFNILGVIGKVIDKVEFLQALSPIDPSGGTGSIDTRYQVLPQSVAPPPSGSEGDLGFMTFGTEAALATYTIPVTDNQWIDLGAVGVNSVGVLNYIEIKVSKANSTSPTAYMYLDGPYEGDSFDTEIKLRVTWHEPAPVRNKFPMITSL
jgi:hypothetical protein